jgi:Zn-dependent peptidase ImmA (M78 family)/transcriptional regulator with XRE-family HTH domain
MRAREDSGLTQDDVAAALGVSRAMLSYWESGKRQPNERQLTGLARLYRVEVAGLLGDAPLDTVPDVAQMMFRGTGPEVPEPALPGLREFVDFLDGYASLAALVGVPIRGLTQSPFLAGAGFESVDDARRKSEEVRAFLRVGLGPIADVDEACELLGVTAFRASLGSDLSQTISGAFLDHADVGFAVLVNLDMTPGRRRFSLAHELAHALFHSASKFEISSSVKTPKERFADTFAGEFLMPTEGIRRVLEEYGSGPRIDDAADVILVQRYFRVSYYTALVRLRQARLLTAARYQEFKGVRPVLYARALGYDIDDEEFEQDPRIWRVRRFPRRYLRVLRAAVRSGAISPLSAAGLTNLSLDEVEELVRDNIGDLPEDDLELNEFESSGVVSA